MKKILFAHSDNDIKDTVGEYLSCLGFNVTKAGTSTELFDLFGKGRYDLIICDMYLEPLDGFKAARKIRETDKDINIMFTGPEEPDFDDNMFMAKYRVYFAGTYRRVKIWEDKIKVTLR